MARHCRRFCHDRERFGAVHEAPAFGEVDYELLVAEQIVSKQGRGPQMICAVGPNGKFTSEAPDFEGQWVKDADKPIVRRLKEEGKLYHQEQYKHEYPFCWRADEDPLIQYPRESWFIRTTQFKDQMLANNQQINWLPEHIKDGRFRKLPGIQRRLGPVARTVLGHAAADLGLRQNGSSRGHCLVRRTFKQTRHRRHGSLGSGEGR